MELMILSISSVIGVLGVITYIQAVPIEGIYTGDRCECSKKLNYLVNMSVPPINKEDISGEYGYKLAYPMLANARVTYRFDFTPTNTKTVPPSPQEKKWQPNAHNKDCINGQVVPKSCGCPQYAITDRYVSPESSAQRYTRNSRHPNSIDKMAEPWSKSHITTIFLAPLKPIELGASKTRNKRDISRIFMRPRKNEKRADHAVKQYNKHLKDISKEKTIFDDSQKPIRSRATGTTAPTTMRPLKQLRSFFTLPSLRNTRDIKGEYDLMEKEHEQKDLTLPEIIQYMPETLDPKFKRNQCHFGHRCQHTEQLETTTKTTTATTTSTSEKSTTMATTESSKASNEDAFSANGENHSKQEEEEKQLKKSLSTAQTKRNAGGCSNGGSLVYSSYNPTQNPVLNYKPLTSFETLPRTFGTVKNPQIVTSHNPYSSTILDNPSVGAAYAKHSVESTSDAELDRIISEIISKHLNFMEASSHRGGALVDPTEVQEKQTKYFLKSLMAAPWNSWFSEDHQQLQPPNVHSYIRPSNSQDTAHIQSAHH